MRWLWGLWCVHFVLGDLDRARQTAAQTLEQAGSDPSCLCAAHHATAGTLVSLGELDAARRHFEAALAAYDEGAPRLSVFGSDLGVFSRAYLAHALWLLGDAEAAAVQAEDAIALARRLGRVYNETLALAFGVDLPFPSRRFQGVFLRNRRPGVVRALRVCVLYLDWAGVLLGWVQGRAVQTTVCV